MSRKHNRGRRGQHFKNHFPAKHDNEDTNSSKSNASSSSKPESHDD